MTEHRHCDGQNRPEWQLSNDHSRRDGALEAALAGLDVQARTYAMGAQGPSPDGSAVLNVCLDIPDRGIIFSTKLATEECVANHSCAASRTAQRLLGTA